MLMLVTKLILLIVIYLIAFRKVSGNYIVKIQKKNGF